jgi:hypothetical protein
MIILSWYSYSLSCLFNWIGHITEKSFVWIQKLGFLPDGFYIVLACILAVVWLFIQHQYDSKEKDKGLID